MKKKNLAEAQKPMPLLEEPSYEKFDPDFSALSLRPIAGLSESYLNSRLIQAVLGASGRRAAEKYIELIKSAVNELENGEPTDLQGAVRNIAWSLFFANAIPLGKSALTERELTNEKVERSRVNTKSAFIGVEQRAKKTEAWQEIALLFAQGRRRDREIGGHQLSTPAIARQLSEYGADGSPPLIALAPNTIRDFLRECEKVGLVPEREKISPPRNKRSSESATKAS